MANPCEIQDCVSPEEIRRHGCLKWLLPLLLLGLGLLLLLSRCGEQEAVTPTAEAPSATTTPMDVPPTNTAVPTEAPTDTPEPEPTDAPATAVPAAVIAPLAAGAAAYAAGNLAWDGTGNAGYLVKMIDADGEVAAETTVDADGNWAFDETLDLEPGEYCFMVQMFDEDGEMVEELAEECITVQPRADVFLPLAAEADNLVYDADSASATWSGSGEPAYVVRIFDADGNEVGTADVGEDGDWLANIPADFEPGEYCMVAEMVNPDGEVVAASESACFTIAAPEEEVVEEPKPTEAPVESSESAETTETEPAGDSDLLVTDVEENVFSGTYQPGTVLLFVEDGNKLGNATVANDGSFAGTCELPPGEHTIVVQDEATGTSETVTLVVAGAPAFEAPTTPRSEPFVCEGTPPNGNINGNTYTIAPCEYISLIASRLGTTVDLIRAYNPQITNFSLIYAGQQLTIPSDAGCFDASN